jgi:pyrimidine-specific ribonucleoside hydrolase
MLRKIFTISLTLVLAACANQPPTRPTPTPFTGTPHSVIIDTDMAIDDWMAILYLFQRADVSVKAITVTGTGEAHCGPGVEHALELAALAGQADIPVSCGRETPLQGSHTFPADWRTNVDALAGLTLPDNPASPSSQSAVQLLSSTIQSSPDKMTLLTLGPLTNVAEALQTTPELKDKIEMVYIMGGAVDVPGNVGRSKAGINNQVAEWNIYVDPHAAALVFQSGVPVTLVPLDATNDAPVTIRFFNRLKDNHITPEANFVFDVLTKNYDFLRSGGYYFWDPLAAAILTENSLARFETKTLTVIEEEGPESGHTKASENGMSIRVATGADRQQFEKIFMDALNAPNQ